MTLLKDDDIRNIASGLETYDNQLKVITGLSLVNLACRAVGWNEPEVQSLIRSCRVCAIPMTCGQGIISNFSETLCAVAQFLGFEAYVTDRTDSAGLAEAFERHADIILTADDYRFVAIHTGTRRVVDNAQATGKGFVAGLAHMAGGLQGRSLLVIGCGPVGQSAALAAARLGARVTLFDIDQNRCHMFAKSHHGRDFMISDTLASALDCNDLIVEATPAENVIDLAVISASTLIAAPGVPCGISSHGREALSSRLLCDPLQIGVATMLMEAALCE
jgi:pyrrolysine biosynthesis protein PylD